MPKNMHDSYDFLHIPYSYGNAMQAISISESYKKEARILPGLLGVVS